MSQLNSLVQSLYSVTLTPRRLIAQCFYNPNDPKWYAFAVTPEGRLCGGCMMLCQAVLNCDFKFHPTYQSLIESAQKCLLCRMFVEALETGGHGQYLRRDSDSGIVNQFEGVHIHARLLEPYSMPGGPEAMMERAMAAQNRRAQQVQTPDQLLNLSCTGTLADGAPWKANVVWCLRGTMTLITFDSPSILHAV
jgi:hypothetical protein